METYRFICRDCGKKFSSSKWGYCIWCTGHDLREENVYDNISSTKLAEVLYKLNERILILEEMGKEDE